MTALLLAHVMILRFLVLTQSISGSITNLDENTELVNSHYCENLCLTEEFPSVETIFWELKVFGGLQAVMKLVIT